MKIKGGGGKQDDNKGRVAGGFRMIVKGESRMIIKGGSREDFE
jgi:hypothetical protein